jgi:hypothetical protein
MESPRNAAAGAVYGIGPSKLTLQWGQCAGMMFMLLIPEFATLKPAIPKDSLPPTQ